MSYNEQVWVDGLEGGTPFNAARGNHIEDGIAAAHDAAAAAQAAAVAAGDAAAAASSGLASKADVSALAAKANVSALDNKSDIGHTHTAASVGAAAAAHSHAPGDVTATGTRNSTTFLRGDGTFAAPPATAPTLANMPAGYTHTARKPGGVWEGSPTTRTDITIQWKGPDPSPPSVSTRTLGVAGMLDEVDTRFVTP